MTKEVILIDAGSGNLRSVLKALQQAGGQVIVTGDPRRVQSGGRLVLPGVGAFGDYMNGLRQRGLEPALIAAVRRGDPLLGICVGMQALFERGEELGQHRGLGLLAGNVVRFPDIPVIKVPHTGWNQLTLAQASPLWKGLANGAYVYFNHSFYCQAQDRQDVTAETEYGSTYASAVQRGQMFGVQFHPEKSQTAGITLLANFIGL